MVEIESSDIVLWLRMKRPHPDLEKLDWGDAPLRIVATQEADLVSLAADRILANDDALSRFSHAVTELRSRADLSVTASVAVFFDHDAVTQNFMLPPDFMKSIGGAVDQIEISVYSTEAASSK
jgi:hypothetical protein